MKSPEELAHQEWLGYVQPVGLVVSIPAMLEAQCYVNKNIMVEHAHFLSCLSRGKGDEPVPEICNLRKFTQNVLGWESEDLKEVPPRVVLSADMASLEVILPQYNETLRPTHAVPAFKPAEGQNPWMMLVQELTSATSLDEPAEADSAKHWNAAPQAKFERLLRETGVPIGLLSNRRQLRLVYAPKGESSGHATFNLQEMMQVAGRPMFAALHMLLCADRMFSLGDNQRLPAILLNSRKYQNTVSTKLSEQVLAALYELMRGFQAANDVRNGDLLHDVLANDPNHVYAGLLRVLMRLVFVMYAEDRDLLSSDPIYSNYYSVTGLFNRLREDAGRHTDTMNQRYGAWSQLLTLFRLIYEGGQHGDFRLPARKGYLFDPDRYPFLEGRKLPVVSSELPESPSLTTDNRQLTTALTPRVSDGVIYKVLRNLLILDGERLSYRTLDVEPIGSVYETLMGFNLELANGRSIAIKPLKSHGAPATINLTELLKTPGKDRAKWLKEYSDQTLGKEPGKQLKDAESMGQLLEALDKKIAKKVTPRTVPKGAIVLQPSDERRRSGLHYTPRSLTEPIVRTTLRPLLKQLTVASSQLLEEAEKLRVRISKLKADNRQLATDLQHLERRLKYAQAATEKQIPHPTQILDLKICDPAMGSGAFLVEACRQLADELVKAWYAHNLVPTDIPPDEDEVLYARRMVAQRCLYGVDKNEMAVDLAKLSLWLVTLAKNHPFTFLDHSLRHGDSLVGLTRNQIIRFHWSSQQARIEAEAIQNRLDRATEARAKILNAPEDVPYLLQQQKLVQADEVLNIVRLTADACVSAFFSGARKKQREDHCEALFADVAQHYHNLKDGTFDVEVRNRIATAVARLRTGEHPIPPFHWEIEFPEVFSRRNSGFDGFLGNPPFFWGNRISSAFGPAYRDWLLTSNNDALGNADFVTYFLRCGFSNTNATGVTGLITTNTVAETDTRESGLGYIARNGGHIFAARRDFKWPGEAGVRVSVVYFSRTKCFETCQLDGEDVAAIGTDLRASSGLLAQSSVPPKSLNENANTAFKGIDFGGDGFQLLDGEFAELVRQFPQEMAVVWPVLNAQDFSCTPDGIPLRHIINFAALELDQASKSVRCMSIVRDRVKPMRDRKKGKERDMWWQYRRTGEAHQTATEHLARVLVGPVVAKHLTFAFYPRRVVFTNALNIFAFDEWGAFCVLQSQVHNIWALRHASTLRTDTRYNPTDCFETFPMPSGWRDNAILDQCGADVYSHRASWMQSHNEGLTDTYNRFHNPHEHPPEIVHLRELHASMDRAVLEAYGWRDLGATAHCEFLPDDVNEHDEEIRNKKSKKKKQWRLRWPDEFRDEVLANLLDLNEQRHKEELLVARRSVKAEKEPQKGKSLANIESQTLYDDQLDRIEELVLLVVTHMGLMTRRAVDEAVLSMQSDTLRRSRLGLCAPPKRMPKPLVGMDAVIGGLLERKWLDRHPSPVQQVLMLGPANSPLDAISTRDKERLEQTRLLFQRELDANTGNVTVTEGITDAKPGFILAG